MSDIYSELSWRGLIHQSTDPEKMPEWLANGSRSLYIGFDPTGESLHVGNLVPLMNLRRFQRYGHRPIALVGGATGMIGDPSGKSEERKLLSRDALLNNVAKIEKQMRNVLDFDGPHAARLVNNFDWMQSFTYLDFLRDVGKNFPVNVMLAKDSVRSRLERSDAGLSYTEFSYMLLQAYDFVYLNQQFGCELQAGASDQWGNITAGIDLGRRMLGKQLYGLTCPLFTKSDGSKMGKSETGAIWLSPERTSPYLFYQFWMQIEDADVDKCLRIFTELTQPEIEELSQARQVQPERRDSQRRLATEVTRLVHGEPGLATAQRASEIFFGAEIASLSDVQLGEIFADVPSKLLARDRLAGGINVVEAFVDAGLAKSKNEARKTITQGGAYVNNRRVESPDTLLGQEHLASETVMVLRSGKRNFALLRFG